MHCVPSSSSSTVFAITWQTASIVDLPGRKLNRIFQNSYQDNFYNHFDDFTKNINQRYWFVRRKNSVNFFEHKYYSWQFKSFGKYFLITNVKIDNYLRSVKCASSSWYWIYYIRFSIILIKLLTHLHHSKWKICSTTKHRSSFKNNRKSLKWLKVASRNT